MTPRGVTRLGLEARFSTKEGLTFGNLKFQSEVSRLGLRKGWRDSKHLDIHWKSIAAYRVATADSKPAEQ